MELQEAMSVLRAHATELIGAIGVGHTKEENGAMWRFLVAIETVLDHLEGTW